MKPTPTRVVLVSLLSTALVFGPSTRLFAQDAQPTTDPNANPAPAPAPAPTEPPPAPQAPPPAPTEPPPAAVAPPPAAPPPAPPSAPTVTPAPVPTVAPTPPTSNAVNNPSGTDRTLRRGPGGGLVGSAFRKIKGRPVAMVPSPVVAPVAPAPAPGAPAVPAVAGAPAAAGKPGIVDLPGEKEFNSCKKLPSGKRIVKLNLKPETELNELIGWISSISCAQFLIANPASLAGKKLTIISPQLITPEEAYRLFLAALESLGYTVEPSGRYLRVVETNKAKFTPLALSHDGDRLPNDKSFVTRLIHTENADATELMNGVLNRIKGEQGDIIAWGANTIIVTDQAMIVNRMLQVIKEVDIPANDGDRIWMVRVKNMSVYEMANRLAEIFQVQQMGTGGRRGANGAAPPPPPPAPAKPVKRGKDLASQMSITKLIPDERTNHLIVVSNETAYNWVVTMMKKLDVTIEGGGDGRVHIYYCAHANCDELAATVGAVTGVAVTGATGIRRNRTGAAPAAPTPTPTPGVPGQQQQALLFEGDVRINFDRPTNSLVVVSSLKDFQSLRKVFELLDAPRKQVFVEALILEVNLDKSRQIGISYHGGGPAGFAGDGSLALGGFGAANTLQPSSLLGQDAVKNGLAGALFGPILPSSATQIFGTTVQIPEFGVLLQALQSNNDVNILSNPSITITNNEEGEITVGQNIPFPGAFFGGGFGGGAAGGTGLGGFAPAVSVQRQDVQLKMKLTPSINEHNLIRLDVDFEISDIAAEDFGNRGLGPSTTKRTAKTPVVTRDEQTVIIGGLMADRVIDTVSKVPILGDIPILGFFFRNTKKRSIKNNIVIAITPYVIDEPGDLRRVTEKKMRERREFIERFTAFQDIASAKMTTDVDYRRKRGMLEEINEAARDLEEEEAELRKIRERDQEDESGPVEPLIHKGSSSSTSGDRPPVHGIPMESPSVDPANPAGG